MDACLSSERIKNLNLIISKGQKVEDPTSAI